MRVTGTLFHMVDVARNVLVIMVMPNTVEVHLVFAAWAGDGVTVNHATDARAERRAAFRAANANLDIVDGVMHGASLAAMVAWND